MAPSLFSQLNSNFQSVFNYLPQNPSQKLIYEQCRITTQRLSRAYTYDDFTTFYNQCYNPLMTIINTINNQNTVKASIVASPNNGSAPLNVTLDARGSTDPSQDTIPNRNFYWYFSDVDGIQKTLWVWPVINHTFTKPGKYIIHLTARSVNRDQWVFDGKATAEINVSPQSAIITVYANGKRMRENTFVKIGTTEAQRWVVLDGTSTSPTGWRRIINHRWDVRSDNFTYTESGRWDPTVIRVALPGNGQYTVTLTTTDNENNQITTSYPLVVSDPVAIIKSVPEQWTTSTNFLFDGWNSYAVSSKLRTYKREIFDPQGNLNDTIQARQINKQFPKPWLYTIKLTVVDELGQSNIDQYKLYVESTQPQAQFTITPTQEWDKPSQFILDATNSNDIDEKQWDRLSYERTFDNPDVIKVEQFSDNKQKAIITVNQVGTHNITLTVRDNYGKFNDITKSIRVDSTLRPSLTINPVAVIRWQATNMQVKSNTPWINYERDLGDGTTNISQFDTISHRYTKVWIYPVSVTVTNEQMETNTVRSRVFVGEANKPIAMYQVSSQQDFGATNIMLPVWECNGNDAYLVDRYQQVFIDASMSVNTKGESNNLNTYFKPQNDRITAASSLRHQFAELWCQSIELTVQDKTQTTQDTKIIYFRVRNALPVVGNISVNFPQYGNEAWIWFFNEKSSDPTFETFEPLIVRLTADNTLDKDWYISYYTWYYYKADDPSRILDTKVTPGNVNTVVFALSREAGEYVFGVRLTDNDDESIRSESIIGKGPVVFLRPWWNQSSDVPIVTLKTSQTNIKVGETVTFTTNSRLLSSRDDFIGNRVFKYDFDGDGVDDLTTKMEEVTHTYTNPSPEEWFKPKVKVLYRGKVGVWHGDSVVVQRWIRPNFIYQTVGKKVMITDLTLWTDKDSTIVYCMNMRFCSNDTSYLITNQKSFMYEYPNYGRYIIKLEAKDAYGNIESTRQIIDLREPSNLTEPSIATLPQLQDNNGQAMISVGNALNNTVSIYVSDPWQQCSIDTDGTIDSNNDGNSTNDANLSCNELHQVQFETILSTITMTVNTSTGPKAVIVNLIDNQATLWAEYEAIGQEITSIITQLSTMSGTSQMQQALIWLRANLGDTVKMTEFVVDIQNLSRSQSLEWSIVNRIQTLIDKLRNASTEAAAGSDPIQQAKAEVLSLVDDATKQQLQPIFDQLDQAWWNKEQVSQYLSSIITIIKNQADQWNLDIADIPVIQEQICNIASYRDVAVAWCTWSQTESPDLKPVPDSSGISWASILRIVIIIVSACGLLFVGFVIYFALKARKKHKEESQIW